MLINGKEPSDGSAAQPGQGRAQHGYQNQHTVEVQAHTASASNDHPRVGVQVAQAGQKQSNVYYDVDGDPDVKSFVVSERLQDSLVQRLLLFLALSALLRFFHPAGRTTRLTRDIKLTTLLNMYELSMKA